MGLKLPGPVFLHPRGPRRHHRCHPWFCLFIGSSSGSDEMRSPTDTTVAGFTPDKRPLLGRRCDLHLHRKEHASHTTKKSSPRHHSQVFSFCQVETLSHALHQSIIFVKTPFCQGQGRIRRLQRNYTLQIRILTWTGDELISRRGVKARQLHAGTRILPTEPFFSPNFAHCLPPCIRSKVGGRYFPVQAALSRCGILLGLHAMS